MTDPSSLPTGVPAEVPPEAPFARATARAWWLLDGPLRAACGLGLVAIVLGLVFQRTPLDVQWALWLNQQQALWPRGWLVLTWSALGISGFLILGVCSANEPRRVAAMLVALVAGGLLVHLIKHQLDLPRPAVVLAGQSGFQHLGEYLQRRSMPSGHATLALALGVLMWQSQRPGAAHTLAWRLGWASLALLQATSRVVVGAHWMSDILVGGGMALLITPFIWRSPWVVRLGRVLDRPLARRLMAVGLVAASVSAALQTQGQQIGREVQALVVLAGLAGATLWWRSAGNNA